MRAFIGLILLSLASLAMGLSLGSVNFSPSELAQLLAGKGTPLQLSLLYELRLPRVLAAFVVGGLLAVAGALMQLLLRNPLADPYILGVAGGAALGALLALLAGFASWAVSGSAFIGALISSLLVFGLGFRQGDTSNKLLLTGVVIATGWGALITFLLALSPQQQLPSLIFWLMGDLSHAPNASLAGAILILACLVLMPLGRSLNIFARGRTSALSLGLNFGRFQLGLYFLTSLLTALAVSLAGTLGFVGLLVPHLVRLTLGYDQRLLVPASLLVGGSLVVLADTLARNLIAPQQLPLGVITALLGVPLFLYLLNKNTD